MLFGFPRSRHRISSVTSNATSHLASEGHHPLPPIRDIFDLSTSKMYDNSSRLVAIDEILPAGSFERLEVFR